MPTCCGVLEKLRDDYDLPFTIPLRLTEELNDIVADEWAIKLTTLTSSGRVSRKHGKPSLVFINYCPFCGKQLREHSEVKVNKS